MRLHHRELTDRILGAAIEVHRSLGPGLLERAYRTCLAHEIRLRHVSVACEVSLDLNSKGLVVPDSYRLDLPVNDQVIVEVKAIQHLLPVHEAQLLTYLRLSGLRVGLLLNFRETLLKNGLKRLIL